MAKIAYVSNCLKSEFEIHGGDCAHLSRLRRQGANVLVMSTSRTAEEFVAEEVAYYTENGQGWTEKDFRILPCARSTG